MGGGVGHTSDGEPTAAQCRPKVARKLTGVSCNSGWGFGAVELYCWWYTEGSWTQTHTYKHTRTHTEHTPHKHPSGRWGRKLKREKTKRKKEEARQEDNRMKMTDKYRKP